MLIKYTCFTVKWLRLISILGSVSTFPFSTIQYSLVAVEYVPDVLLAGVVHHEPLVLELDGDVQPGQHDRLHRDPFDLVVLTQKQVDLPKNRRGKLTLNTNISDAN